MSKEPLDRTPIKRNEFEKRNRAARARTVFISVVCSGIVALFIGHAVEVASYNSQAKNAADVCRSDKLLLAEIADDVSKRSNNPGVKMRWSGYEQRSRMGAEDCDDKFQTRQVFGIPFISNDN